MTLAGKHWVAAVIWVALFAGIYVVLDAQMRPKVAMVGAAGEISIPRSRDDHFYLSGEINGQAVTFMVDTGASTVSVGRALADRLGLPRGRPVQVSTANGVAAGEEIRGLTVRLGEIEIRDVRAVVLPGMGQEALLGQNVLRHLDVEQGAGVMRLKPRPAGAQ